MHEFSIATDVAAAVAEFAEEHPDEKVSRVHLQIGELTCVGAEQLAFCYNAIIAESPLAGSELKVEITRAHVECRHCKYEGKPHYWDSGLAALTPTLQCPKCGQAAEAIAGHECAIRSIQFSPARLQTA
jgi:hydrogenase nickel incorporation protein HypA/HybF